MLSYKNYTLYIYLHIYAGSLLAAPFKGSMVANDSKKLYVYLMGGEGCCTMLYMHKCYGKWLPLSKQITTTIKKQSHNMNGEFLYHHRGTSIAKLDHSVITYTSTHWQPCSMQACTRWSHDHLVLNTCVAYTFTYEWSRECDCSIYPSAVIHRVQLACALLRGKHGAIFSSNTKLRECNNCKLTNAFRMDTDLGSLNMTKCHCTALFTLYCK